MTLGVKNSSHTINAAAGPEQIIAVKPGLHGVHKQRGRFLTHRVGLGLQTSCMASG